MISMEPRVLVTGSKGFIGGAVVRELERRGIRWAPDAHAMAVTHVIHCGWPVRPERINLVDQQVAALAGTIRLYEQCLDAGVKHFVSLGTCWENVSTLRDVYSSAKMATGVMLQACAARGGTPVTWAQVFQPYGPGEGAHRLIPQVLATLAEGRELKLRTNGEQVRDWTYIDSLATMLVNLALNPPLGPFRVAQVSTNCVHSVRQVVERLGDIAGRPGLVAFGDEVDPVPCVIAAQTAPGELLSPGLLRTIHASGLFG